MFECNSYLCIDSFQMKPFSPWSEAFLLFCSGGQELMLFTCPAAEYCSLKLNSALFPSHHFPLPHPVFSPAGIAIASALIDISQQKPGDFKDQGSDTKSRKQHLVVHHGSCVWTARLTWAGCGLRSCLVYLCFFCPPVTLFPPLLSEEVLEV